MHGEAAAAPDRCLLEARNISKSFPGVIALDDVSLRVSPGTVHALIGENGAGKSTLMKIIAGIIPADAGEILGNAGLVGAGRSNLAEALFGVTPASCGKILIGGTEVEVDSPRAALSCGMAFVTEDRKETGCLLTLSVLDNLDIAVLTRDFVRLGFVRGTAVREKCAAISRQLRVKTPDLGEPIVNLSGGNQQKVLIGRWLLTAPRILILDEPTRGIDVAAKAEIHQLIAQLAARGTAVLMISSELPEILGMSHRVMVMHEGRVTGVLEREQADQEKIMALAAQ